MIYTCLNWYKWINSTFRSLSITRKVSYFSVTENFIVQVYTKFILFFSNNENQVNETKSLYLVLEFLVYCYVYLYKE